MRPRLKSQWKRFTSNDANLQNGNGNQMKELRGGGNGGGEESKSAKKFFGVCNSNCVGGSKISFSATGGYSIFNVGETASVFFSDFLAVAMALHRQHGCSPSKVLATDSATESWQRLSASIVVHATVCRAIQCRPSEAASIVTRNSLDNRKNTRGEYQAAD